MQPRRVSDIQWESWQPEETATLLFVIRNGRILLIRKKRGLGAGKINGPGGRLESGETPLECAIRETREELLINPVDVRFAGELFFHAEDMPRIHGYVYTATDFEGTPTETEEADPVWFPVHAIPWSEMWDDDIHWLPRVISGEVVQGRFIFEGESLIDHEVTSTSI